MTSGECGELGYSSMYYLPPTEIVSALQFGVVIAFMTLKGLRNGNMSLIVRMVLSFPYLVSCILYLVFSVFTLTILQIQFLGRWERTLSPIAIIISVYVWDWYLSERVKEIGVILDENATLRHERDDALKKLKQYEE